MKATVNNTQHNHFIFMFISFRASNTQNARCRWSNEPFGLGRRILLASSFDSRQHSYSHQHNASDNNPVPGHMRQDGAIDQPAGQDGKAGNVDGE